MKSLSAGCVLIITFSFCAAQRAPSITYISEDQQVDVGSSVELTCSAQFAEDFSVIWVKKSGSNKNDYIFLSTDTSLVVKESRFALLYDGASATYIVLIKDLQESDAGVYQCEIVLSVNNKITAETRLSVRRPPVITDNSTQSIVTSEGQSIQMECYATGFPSPKIVWRRENNALLPTGGSIYNGNVMKIHSISKEDRGTYYCFADNEVGKGDRRNVNIEIEFSPKITVPRPKIGQALHYDMDLECHIEAFPPPQIIWVKDEILLSNGKKYKISNFVTADEFTDSTLRIVTLDERQYGNYKCKAVNKLGSDEAQINLYETSSPVCPPACGQGYSSASSLKNSSLATFLLAIIIINSSR